MTFFKKNAAGAVLLVSALEGAAAATTGRDPLTTADDMTMTDVGMGKDCVETGEESCEKDGCGRYWDTESNTLVWQYTDPELSGKRCDPLAAQKAMAEQRDKKWGSPTGDCVKNVDAGTGKFVWQHPTTFEACEPPMSGDVAPAAMDPATDSNGTTPPSADCAEYTDPETNEQTSWQCIGTAVEIKCEFLAKPGTNELQWLSTVPGENIDKRCVPSAADIEAANLQWGSGDCMFMPDTGNPVTYVWQHPTTGKTCVPSSGGEPPMSGDDAPATVDPATAVPPVSKPEDTAEAAKDGCAFVKTFFSDFRDAKFFKPENSYLLKHYNGSHEADGSGSGSGKQALKFENVCFHATKDAETAATATVTLKPQPEKTADRVLWNNCVCGLFASAAGKVCGTAQEAEASTAALALRGARRMEDEPNDEVLPGVSLADVAGALGEADALVKIAIQAQCVDPSTNPWFDLPESYQPELKREQDQIIPAGAVSRISFSSTAGTLLCTLLVVALAALN